MMKGTTTKNVFLLLFLFVCLGTHAQEASQEAIGVAREFIRSSEGFAKMRKAGRRIELTATPIEGTPFHAVNLAEGRGFVLVDTHGNVCGYSDEGNFDPTVLPAGMLEAAQDRPNKSAKTGAEADAYRGVYGTYQPVAPLSTMVLRPRQITTMR